MRWDLDRAVNFFMENGADGMFMLPKPAITHEVVELSDTDSPAAPREPPALAVDDEDDPELQEALAASRRAGAWVPPSEAMIPIHSNGIEPHTATVHGDRGLTRVYPPAQMAQVPLHRYRLLTPAQST